MARRKAKSSTLTVDFSNTESKLKPGEYLATVEEVSVETSQSNTEYLKWKFKLDAGGIAYYNTSLQPQALWNLRNLLEALGVEVPNSALDLDLEDMLGRELMVLIDEEEWEGKKRPKMTDFWAAEEKTNKIEYKKGKDDEDDDVEEEEEEEAPKKSSKKKSRVVDDEDEEEDDEPAPRRKSSKKDEDEDEEEDEEEDDEQPMYSMDDIETADEKQLATIIKRHKLKVKEGGNLRRQRANVILALEDAGLIESDD